MNDVVYAIVVFFGIFGSLALYLTMFWKITAKDMPVRVDSEQKVHTR